MSSTLNVEAYAGKNSEEFKKHYKAVVFCIENELSFPKETFEFFKGKVAGSDLDEIRTDAILECIENGIEVDLKKTGSSLDGEIRIQVSDIPKEVDELIISYK